MLLLLIAQSKTLAAYTCIFFLHVSSQLCIIVLWVSFFHNFFDFFTIRVVNCATLTDILYLFCVRFGLVAGQDSRVAVGYESFLGICPRIKL